MQPDPVLGGLGVQRSAQGAVGGHAAGEHHPLHPDAQRRSYRLAHQHLHHRRLKGRRDIGHLGVAERPVTPHVERDRRLDPAEGEIARAVGHLRQRELDRAGVAALGRPLADRAPREAPAQELGDLVERLARRAAPPPAAQVIRQRGGRVVERRVAARDHQREEGKLGRVVGEERRVHVSLEMVHSDEWQTVGPGQRLGHRAAHEQAADQPRAVRHRDAVEVT